MDATIPFWNEDCRLKTYSPLSEHMTCDVCIIGAGISGLTTAYLLSKSKKKVIVLDDGPIAGGQTFRTTGHLSNALDDRYFVLESYFGEKGARLAAESHRAAIDFISSLVSTYRILCNFEVIPAYLFAPSEADQHILQKELEAAQRAGLNATMVSRAPLESFDTGPAICFAGQAHLHPLKYIDRLCELIEAEGGLIYGDTHVCSLIEKNGYRLDTHIKKHIQADHVVVATNSPINSRFFPHVKQAAYRTYVIAGRIPKGYVKAGLYYDTLDPYHYIRIAKDKNGEDILMVGGEDHRTGEEKNIPEKYRNLESWTRERFPFFGEVRFYWSGQIMEPVDCLGFIGKMHKDKEVYIITGDSGNGLTHATIGGLLIHDLIEGGQSPWTDIYNPHRTTLKATSDFLRENINSAMQYMDWFTPGENTELARNCGIIVRKGIKKCALYRDESGTVHEMSAVCPHLGAIVRWNASEHCWECPAHGSRFDAMGQVIQGPSNCHLKMHAFK